MVFPWFSHGFPMAFLWFLDVFWGRTPPYFTLPQRGFSPQRPGLSQPAAENAAAGAAARQARADGDARSEPRNNGETRLIKCKRYDAPW